MHSVALRLPANSAGPKDCRRQQEYGPRQPLSLRLISATKFYCRLLPRTVTFGFVLLHHGASSHFFCPLAIAARPRGTFLDVFVFALFFCANAAQMFLSRHRMPFRVSFCLLL